MPTWRQVRQRVVREVDERALAAIYAAVSVSPGPVRASMAARRLAVAGEGVDRAALDRTVEALIADAAGSAATLGGLAGLAGLLSVPPEAAAFVVAMVRLAQRLAIIHGLDPASERGRVAVARALAAAFEVDIPDDGLLTPRLRDLLASLASTAPAPSEGARRLGGQLLRGVAVRSLRIMTGRVGRLLPLVSSGVSAADNHARVRSMGRRMAAAVRSVADAPLLGGAGMSDAVVVG